LSNFASIEAWTDRLVLSLAVIASRLLIRVSSSAAPSYAGGQGLLVEVTQQLDRDVEVGAFGDRGLDAGEAAERVDRDGVAVDELFAREVVAELGDRLGLLWSCRPARL